MRGDWQHAVADEVPARARHFRAVRGGVHKLDEAVAEQRVAQRIAVELDTVEHEQLRRAESVEVRVASFCQIGPELSEERVPALESVSRARGNDIWVDGQEPRCKGLDSPRLRRPSCPSVARPSLAS